MTHAEIKEKIIQNAVKNQHEFGFPQCNKENIFTDIMYSQFFASSLKDNYGHSAQFDEVLRELEKEIKTDTL